MMTLNIHCKYSSKHLYITLYLKLFIFVSVQMYSTVLFNQIFKFVYVQMYYTIIFLQIFNLCPDLFPGRWLI